MSVDRFAVRGVTLLVCLLSFSLGLLSLSGRAVGAGAESWPHPDSSSVGAKLTLNRPHPRSVFEDRQAGISGALVVGNDAPVAHQRIILDRRVDGTRWSPWLHTSTDEVGSYSFSLAPRRPQAAELRTRQVDVAGETLETSGLQQLTVLDRSLALHARQRYVTFGEIDLRGKTRPPVASAPIAIQRFRHGGWRRFGATTTRADGTYRYRMPDRLPGTWRVRAIWDGVNPAAGTREISVPRRYEVRVVLAPHVEPVTTVELGATWHEGCPVGAGSLRSVWLTYRTYNGVVKRGVLVVHASIVPEVIDVWRSALKAGYPYHSLISVAEFGGSDPRSMWHDNTSAFNCRTVTGDPFSLSPHSYGTAIDINPVRNPYLDSNGRWWPHRKGASYRHRADAREGMLYATSKVTSRLEHFGFQWGGYWSHPDYQHFDPRSGKGRVPVAVPRNAAKAPSVAQPQHGPAPTSSGPLTSAALPDPVSLGRGWQRYVEAGGEEEGWLGNGTFSHARDPHEAANGVLPLGCSYRPELTLPVPTHALQGSYRAVRGASAHALVLQFGSTRQARHYFAGLTTLLEGCDRADGVAGLVVSKLDSQPTHNAGVRRYGDATRWSELDVQAGDRVAVLVSSRPVGDEQAAVRALRVSASR